MRHVCVVVVAFSLFVSAAEVRAQHSSGGGFEAASVALNRTGSTRGEWSAGFGFDQFGRVSARPGLLAITNVRLRRIIGVAYDIHPSAESFSLVGGNPHILDSNFDIRMRTRDDATSRDILAMLQALLKERFALKTHTEIRQVPVYAVRVSTRGELGPQLKPSPYDCTSPQAQPVGPDGHSVCPRSVIGFSQANPSATTLKYFSPISYLLLSLQRFIDRPLVDATGLKGSYEWSLTFSSRQTTLDAQGADLSTALTEQVGLTLERRKGPVRVLVIEHVERPTPN